VLGTLVSRICGYEFPRTGVTRAEAADAGYAIQSVVDSSTRADYFPGATSMKPEFFAERRTGPAGRADSRPGYPEPGSGLTSLWIT
jgi:hypothetical protein